MNAKELSDRMADHAADIAAYLLPQGKKASGEWKAGSISGEPGSSLSVRLSGAKAGVWRDFAADVGGDLLDLWMAVRACSLPEAMNEAKAYLGIRDETMVRPTFKPFVKPVKPKDAAEPSGTVRDWLRERFIDDATIDAFKIRQVMRGGKPWAMFPYLREGVLVNAKYRDPENKRGMAQEKDAEPCLFGWHLISPKERRIVITEGEIDAMTFHQMGLPALSVNAGAGNHQWIENDWQRLQRFSDILIAFDHDEAGDKGAAEVMDRLGLERCRRVQVGAKDANEWLQQGATAEDFRIAASQAQAHDPEEMAPVSAFLDAVIAHFYPPEGTERNPVLRLDSDHEWFEFRPGELTVWTGINGHGKTLMLSQVQLGLIAQGQRFMVFSGEMPPKSLLVRTARQASGTDRPTKDYIRTIWKFLDENLWIYNLVGSATVKRLIEVFTYAARRYRVGHFVIDSLMMTDVPEDGPGAMTAQKNAIRMLTDFAKRSGVHVHLVAHPRKARDETAAPGKMDVAGSGKVTDGADNVFSVWKADKDENEPDVADVAAHAKWVDMQERPDAKLELRKQRNGDTQSFCLNLWYDKHSMQYRSTKKRYRPIAYVDHRMDQEEVPA